VAARLALQGVSGPAPQDFEVPGIVEVRLYPEVGALLAHISVYLYKGFQGVLL